MSRSVDDLRTELKSLGYLSHGLERWFARDPWRSGTFWTELLTVASKASLVIAIFAAAAAATVMVNRNDGLPPFETALVSALYFVAAFITALALHLIVALGLKARLSFGIENPRRLTVIAMALSGVIALGLVAWWTAFPTDPGTGETVAFIALLVLLFFASSIVVSAALLSFSIHEAREIPSIHRRSRTAPLLIGAFLLLLLIFGQALSDTRSDPQIEAHHVVVRPTQARVAFVAVDGLSPELFELRPQLRDHFRSVTTADVPEAASAPEAWATIGTGTPPDLHRVRSVEGIRLTGGRRVIQNVSPLDYPLRIIAPTLRIAERQPLPPSVRDRHYIWESLTERGVPALAVNWWTSEDRATGAATTVSQETIFALASGRAGDPAALAIAIDQIAIDALVRELAERDPRFTTVYLPALDVILNRIAIPERDRLAATIQALDQLLALVTRLAENGWSLILVGTPGESAGDAVIATTLDLDGDDPVLEDIAPTLLSLYGFPPSLEMSGESLVPTSTRVTSYGSRETEESGPVSDDYYENLKSLGYIQ